MSLSDRPFLIPSLHHVERGTGGEVEAKRARFRGKRARSVSRVPFYELSEHHPMPATTAPQPCPLPEERAHIIRQGGQQRVVVWCTIMLCYLRGSSRRVNHTFGWLTAIGPAA